MSHRWTGLTLVELLVAMAILGVLFAAITAFLGGSLRFSSVAITTADRTRELNDVTAYVLDVARGASSVAVGDCGASQCAVLVVPATLDATTNQIASCRVVVFRVRERATAASAAPALPAVMLGGATISEAPYVMEEFRETSPTAAVNGACSGTAAPVTSFTGYSGPFLVLDGLVQEQIFTVAANPQRLSVSLSVGNASRTGVRVTPAAGTYTAEVLLRN